MFGHDEYVTVCVGVVGLVGVPSRRTGTDKAVLTVPEGPPPRAACLAEHPTSIFRVFSGGPPRPANSGGSAPEGWYSVKPRKKITTTLQQNKQEAGKYEGPWWVFGFLLLSLVLNDSWRDGRVWVWLARVLGVSLSSLVFSGEPLNCRSKQALLVRCQFRCLFISPYRIPLPST